MAFTFWADLAGYTFDDTGENTVVEIQALPINKYKHPSYGEINVTAERVTRMAANVNNNVRGQQLDIDYDHKKYSGDASGWVKSARAVLDDPDPKKNGLYLSVDFTKEALTKLKNKAYRYFSPEFTEKWTNPIDKIEYKDVLFGGGLTNRPFLKDILPINCDELNIDLGGHMDKETLTLLGLSEDATGEKISEAIKKLHETAAAKDVTPKVEPKGEPEKKTLSEDDKTKTEVQKLAEENPVVKALVEQMDKMETSLKLSEVNAKIDSLDDAKNGFVVAPAQKDELRKQLMEVSPEAADAFIKLFSEQTKNIVKLGEKGQTKTQSFEDPVDELHKRVTTAMKADEKLDYAGATMVVLDESPELYDAYRNETYVKERGA